MNFQELTTIWNNADIELENSIKINQKLIKEVSVAEIKSHLFETKWSAIIENCVNFFWISFLIRFIIENFHEVKFAIPAGILLFFSVFSFVISGFILILFFQIKASDPLLKTQLYVEKIRVLEILGLNALYVIIPLFSLPFLIVVSKYFTNLDIYTLPIFGKNLVYYTIGCILIAIILVYILKKYTNKSLKESISFLKELQEIENEETFK